MLVDRDYGQHETVFRQVSAVADHDILHHLIQRAGIDAHAADRDRLALARPRAVDLERFARFEHKRVFQAPVAQVLRQLSMASHLAILAVNGDEEFRPNQIQHQPQFLSAAVTGNVNRRVHGSVEDIGATPRQVIDHPVDGFFVAGNDSRAQRHDIAVLDRKTLVIVDGHARKGRHRLALRA